ncbi:heparin lyase I family protein [Novosphingobium sp.]|uniref:heparin lyase I family protein n=1 Tax=Novosphingobium sp. TaxID=1874826 RepID=UPI0038B6FF5A
MWRPQTLGNGNVYRVLGAATYSVKACSDQAWRFETRQGDQITYETDRTRAEMVDLNGSVAYGVDQWAAFDFRVDLSPGPLAPAQQGGWLLFGQLHQTAGASDVPGASPIFSFNMQADGEMGLATNGSTQNPLMTLAPSTIRGKTSGFTVGKWHRSVVRFRLDPSAGNIAWWLDGMQITNVSGIPLGFATDTRAYWQFGIYTGPIGVPMTAVAHYANVFPPTTASLASRIGAAAPPIRAI